MICLQLFRQAALSADNVMSTSLVAAEQEDRSTFLQEIGKGETTPTIEQHQAPLDDGA